MSPYLRFLSIPLILVLLPFNVSLSGSTLAPKRFGLLTEDYGIVTAEDVRKELRHVLPECWEFREECILTNYWFCLQVTEVHMACESMGEAEEVGWAAAHALRVSTESKVIEFSFRRAIEESLCENDLREWERILDTDRPTCFAASSIEEERSKDPLDPRPRVYGQLDRMKSDRGSWSFFGDPSDLRFQK